MTDFLVNRSNLRDAHWANTTLPPLSDGNVRLKVEAFALTANNVTYAAFGDAMNYWKFFPAAEPAFGRVPVWGFATVVESGAQGISSGTRVYGYLPMSDFLDITPGKVSQPGFIDVAPHRADLAPIYNTYVSTAADPTYDPAHEAQQMLFRPLFTTGWMIDDSLMANGDPLPETVVISSASSKTALALAYCLKSRGQVDTLALTSARNMDFVASTGLYGRVQTYDDVDHLHTRGLTAYVDFLGRPALTADVHNALKDRLVRSLVIGVTDWEASRVPLSLPGPAPEFFFVPTYAANRAKTLGADAMNQRLGAALMGFYTASSRILTPVEAAGPEAIARAWQDTVEARIKPSEGLICRI